MTTIAAVFGQLLGDLRDHARVGHGVGDGRQDLLGHLRRAVLDEEVAAHHLRRHGAGVGREAALDVERLPGALFFVFGDAARVLRRRALGALIELVRPNAEDIHDDQAQRAADGGVGAIARAEDVAGAS